MPEIAEGMYAIPATRKQYVCILTNTPVARLVHFLRQHLVGKKIALVRAPDDVNIFGKVGCSGPAFEKALKGRKVGVHLNSHLERLH